MLSQLYKKIRLLTRKGKEPYSSIYKIVGFYPNNPDLYKQAFLHKSQSIEDDDGKWLNNERLEFLGDAILSAVVADIVYKHFENKREGFLTNTRSKIVSRDSMNRIGLSLGIEPLLRYSVNTSTLHESHNSNMLGNALEALIGAIYLDGGFANAKEFILKYILNDLEGKRLFYDSKTILQEMVQGGQEKGIVYQLVGEEGPDHNKSFRVEVVIGGEAFGCGIGRTKKAAEQEAAYQAILKLKEGKVQ